MIWYWMFTSWKLDYVCYIILRKHRHKEQIPNGVTYWAVDRYEEIIFLVVPACTVLFNYRQITLLDHVAFFLF